MGGDRPDRHGGGGRASKKIRRSDSSGSHHSESTVKSQMMAMRQYQRSASGSSRTLSDSDGDNEGGVSLETRKKPKSLGGPVKKRRKTIESESDVSSAQSGRKKRRKVAKGGGNAKSSSRVAPPKRKQGTASPPATGVNSKRELKPLLAVGQEVTAAWWPTEDSRRDNSESSWYEGRVKAIKEVDKGSPYGPVRYYDIEYDDGDELDAVEDVYVMPRFDYDLSTERKQDWIGVTNETDEPSSDQYARMMGWYTAYIDGQEASFSLLSEALRAYDSSVVRRKGAKTKRRDLNLPEEWEFFKKVRAQDDKRVGRGSQSIGKLPSTPTARSKRSPRKSATTGSPDSTLSNDSDSGRKKKTSDYVGVSVAGKGLNKTILSRIWVKGDLCLGSYDLEADAAFSHDEAVRLLKLHSKKLNFSSIEAYERAKKLELETAGSDKGVSSAVIVSRVAERISKHPDLLKNVAAPEAAGAITASVTMDYKSSGKKKGSALPSGATSEINALNEAMEKKWSKFLPKTSGEQFLKDYQKDIDGMIDDMKPQPSADVRVSSTVSVGNETAIASLATKDSSKDASVDTSGLQQQSSGVVPGTNNSGGATTSNDDKPVAAVQTVNESVPRDRNELDVTTEKQTKPNEGPAQNLGAPVPLVVATKEKQRAEPKEKAPIAPTMSSMLSSRTTNTVPTLQQRKTDILMKLTTDQASDLSYPVGCQVWFQYEINAIEGQGSTAIQSQSFRAGVVSAAFLDFLSRDVYYQVKLAGGDKKEMVSEHCLSYAPKCPVYVASSPEELKVNTNCLRGEVLMCRAKSHQQIVCEVKRLQQSLAEEQAAAGANEKLLDIIKRLGKIPMTRAILVETRIGKSVAKLKCGDERVIQKAGALVSRWREIANAEKNLAGVQGKASLFYTLLVIKEGNQFHVEESVLPECIKYRKVAKAGAEEEIESSNSTITTATGLS